jgi:histidinol phosphatase-like PHP family hydrolase
LADIQYGVMTARKGWLEKDDVINSMSSDALYQQLSLQ